MNILDIIIIAIILLFLFRGFAKGFVYSVFDVASFIIAAIVSAKYNKYVSEFFRKTVIYEKINEAVNNTIINNINTPIEVTKLDLKDVDFNTIKNSLDSIVIPVHAKEMIFNNIEAGFFNHSDALSNLSNIITEIIITILSIILIFILVKVLLSIIAFFLHQFMSLPVLSTVNRLFGGVFGIVNGLFVIYLVFGIISIINITNTFELLPDLINNSIMAKNFFYNNLLLEYLFNR